MCFSTKHVVSIFRVITLRPTKWKRYISQKRRNPSYIHRFITKIQLTDAVGYIENDTIYFSSLWIFTTADMRTEQKFHFPSFSSCNIRTKMGLFLDRGLCVARLRLVCLRLSPSLSAYASSSHTCIRLNWMRCGNRGSQPLKGIIAWIVIRGRKAKSKLSQMPVALFASSSTIHVL